MAVAVLLAAHQQSVPEKSTLPTDAALHRHRKKERRTMPVVSSPISAGDALDSFDRADYHFDFSSLLPDAAEIISSQTVTMSAAGVAAGLLMTDPAAPSIHPDGKGVVVWFSVTSGSQNSTLFDSAGTSFLVEVSINTNQLRKYQRTFDLKVKQQ
jgi:hypothetical protein